MLELGQESALGEGQGSQVGSEIRKKQKSRKMMLLKSTELNTSTRVSGDSLTRQVGMQFSTVDQDNDVWSGGQCAQLYKGAWWYKACHDSNLNGHYYGGPHQSWADGVEWKHWTGYYYSLRFTEMKFRPNIE